MAVLGRLLISSAERLDLPDVLAIDSYAAGDFKYLLKGLVNDTKPYILKGFDIIDPQNAIGTQTCSVRIADSAVFYPGSDAGPFFYGLPEGDPNAQPLVPELRKNAVNYVYLTFTTFNTSTDSRAFWDPDKDGGVGGEFTQDVNTESVLTCQVNVSVGAFPDNTIPIAKVTVGAVVITAIEDARDMLFRLGTGGINPDPFSTYNWRALPSAPYERNEPPTTMVAGGVNPFEGADKNILSLKEWMDAVMSKLRELGGTIHWYDDASTFSIVNTFIDALTTTFKSKGLWLHDGTTPGLVTWTDDINIILTGDPRQYILRAGNVTLADGQVAYLDLIRNKPINSTDAQVAFTNGQPYVNTVGGSVGLFANLTIGDWIKSASDPNQNYSRVEQFWDSVNGSGSPTTAALAKSISLNANYNGPTANDRGRYDKGVYTSADVVVSNRSQAAIASAGGDFSWLVVRSDTIENVGNAVTTNLTVSIATGDGSKALVTSSAHGLSDGQRVTIAGTTNYNGTFQVEVSSANSFYINTTTTAAGPQAGTGHYAIITTAARSNAAGTLVLESANHGFNTDDIVQIAGTTNYNGTYRVAVIDATHFQIATAAAAATETSGTVTLAKVLVRSELGAITLIQGQSGSIGDQLAQNIKAFLGMTSDNQTSPDYNLPSGYNTLNGTENFNSDPVDNVTARLSKLSGMMADKAQDKTIKYLTEASSVTNTTNGAAQELTFTPGGSTLTILQPGSPGNAVVTLPSASPGISLLVNQSAYVIIDRNAATTPSIVVADTATLPVGENTIVIAARLGDTVSYIWNGTAVNGSSPIGPGGSGLTKIDLYSPVNTTLPTGNPVLIDNVSVTAGMLVLFSALSSGNNEIYMAVGSGTNITSWTAQPAFSGFVTPADADLVIVKSGQGFANQIGEFNGTTWLFNNTVRYFNGADYWEQSAIISSTLLDNTSGNVFSVAWLGSENMIVDYSLLRGALKETGSINVTTDGTNVSVVSGAATLGGAAGIAFSGSISGSNLLLSYVSTSTGIDATMKYSVKRWSDSSGGPGGVPTYSGSVASGVTSLNGLTGIVNLAAGANITLTPSGNTITIASTGGGGGTPSGPTNSIQYNDSGSFNGNANFLVDTVNGALNLNGLSQTALSSAITINNGAVSPTSLFTYSASTYPFAIIEYSMLRNGLYRVGRFLVTNDGSTTGFSDDFVDTASNGVTLTASIVGPNVAIQYTSTNTGFAGTFKFSVRRWS